MHMAIEPGGIPKDERQPGVTLLVTTCEPIEQEFHEMWAIIWEREFLGTVMFLGFFCAPIIALTRIETGGSWMLVALLFIAWGPVNLFLGAAAFHGIGRLLPLFGFLVAVDPKFPRFYSLPVAFGMGFLVSTVSSYVLPRIDASVEFTWANVAVATIFLTILGEVYMIYAVKVGVPLVMARKAAASGQKATLVDGPAHTGTPFVGLVNGTGNGASAPEVKPDASILVVRGHLIDPGDVIMVKAEGNYVNIVETDRSTLVPGPLFEVLEELNGIQGFQVHRSIWIARHACEEVRLQGKKMSLVLTNGENVSVARARKSEVHKALSDAGIPSQSIT